MKEEASLVSMAPAYRIQLPSHLDGSQGAFRCNVSECAAQTDPEALVAWISTVDERSRRIYERALDQLLCWCVAERHKPLTSLDQDDLDAFGDFTLSVAPASRWICPRGTRRDAPDWKPFAVDRASLHTRRLTGYAIKSCLRWMRDTRYAVLPIQLDRRSSSRMTALEIPQVPFQTLTSLEHSDMFYVWQALELDNKPMACERMTLMVLKYFLCLDNKQIVLLKVKNFGWSDGFWYLESIGSKALRRPRLLLPPVVNNLMNYGLLVHGNAAARAAHPDGDRAITKLGVSSVDKHLDGIFATASEHAAARDSDASARLAVFRQIGLRYALSKHAWAASPQGPRSASLARSAVGAQPWAHILSTPRALRPTLHPLSTFLSEKTTDALEVLWEQANELNERWF